MGFKIKHVIPMFTGVITTAKRYVGDIKTASGLLIDTTRMEGGLNPYQTIIAVGSTAQNQCPDLKEGAVVKINFKRYAKTKHTPGAIDQEQNLQVDNMSLTYEIPMINLDGQECLNIQSNDVEYIVDQYEVDEGGLLQ